MIWYQFQVDGRAVRPPRTDWEQAAQDAVNVGYGTWVDELGAVALDGCQGATIERIIK